MTIEETHTFTTDNRGTLPSTVKIVTTVTINPKDSRHAEVVQMIEKHWTEIRQTFPVKPPAVLDQSPGALR
jgi:hypothetical protein